MKVVVAVVSVAVVFLAVGAIVVLTSVASAVIVICSNIGTRNATAATNATGNTDALSIFRLSFAALAI